jgi:hypothetical protein
MARLYIEDKIAYAYRVVISGRSGYIYNLLLLSSHCIRISPFSWKLEKLGV